MKIKFLWILCLILFLGTQVSHAQRAKPNKASKAAMAKKKMASPQGKSKLQKKMKAKALTKAKEKAQAQRKNKQGNTSGQGAAQSATGQARGATRQKRIKALSALQLSDDLLLQLDSIHLAAFQVDEEGILKPNPGYHMGFHEGQNKIFIKPVAMKFDRSMMQNESQELASGIRLFCLDCASCDKDDSLNGEGEVDACTEFLVLSPSAEIQQLE